MGCLSPAFSGPCKWAELLRHPILGGPRQRGQNQNWLPHPCLLRGPQVGGIATPPLHSRGSPTKGIKLKVATSPLPSRGPTIGQNCCVNLRSRGSPAKGTKSKVAALGARTKLWMCSPKEYHQKNVRRNGVLVSKNTLKIPHGPFLKRGGGSKTPHTIGFLRTPPPLWAGPGAGQRLACPGVPPTAQPIHHGTPPSRGQHHLCQCNQGVRAAP